MLGALREARRDAGGSREIPVGNRHGGGGRSRGLCYRLLGSSRKTMFFAGKVIFQREKWYQPFLHNETAFAMEKRLQWVGQDDGDHAHPGKRSVLDGENHTNRPAVGAAVCLTTGASVAGDLGSPLTNLRFRSGTHGGRRPCGARRHSACWAAGGGEPSTVVPCSPLRVRDCRALGQSGRPREDAKSQRDQWSEATSCRTERRRVLATEFLRRFGEGHPHPRPRRTSPHN